MRACCVSPSILVCWLRYRLPLISSRPPISEASAVRALDGRIHADLEGLDRCTVALQGAGHAVEMAVLIDG